MEESGAECESESLKAAVCVCMCCRVESTCNVYVCILPVGRERSAGGFTESAQRDFVDGIIFSEKFRREDDKCVKLLYMVSFKCCAW